MNNFKTFLSIIRNGGVDNFDELLLVCKMYLFAWYYERLIDWNAVEQSELDAYYYGEITCYDLWLMQELDREQLCAK